VPDGWTVVNGETFCSDHKVLLIVDGEPMRVGADAVYGVGRPQGCKYPEALFFGF